MAEMDPALCKSLSVKRSQVLDIDKSKVPDIQIWNLINPFPKEKVEAYIRPNILVKD